MCYKTLVCANVNLDNLVTWNNVRILSSSGLSWSLLTQAKGLDAHGFARLLSATVFCTCKWHEDLVAANLLCSPKREIRETPRCQETDPAWRPAGVHAACGPALCWARKCKRFRLRVLMRSNLPHIHKQTLCALLVPAENSPTEEACGTIQQVI